jgi:GDP-L-fucose synthase
LADALVFIMAHYSAEEPLSIGIGEDITVAELARLIADVVEFDGDFAFDPSKPDGTPRKLLDVSRLHALGWHARTSLEEGLAATYRWYLENEAVLKGAE